jgi:uncharacterized protein (TIGR01777 family)
MRIAMGGGTGFLGSALAERLRRDGHTVAVLPRNPPATAVDDTDAVVNLAGASIAGGRWTARRKALILDSRVRATRTLAAAILAAARPPSVFISGSAVGFYGLHGAEPLTEASPPGTDFLAGVCVEWEREARAAESATRLVLVRTGVALHASGGALPHIALPFHLFAGGPLGSGQQYMSWIHRDDWVEMIRWALMNTSLSGPVNATAPNPVTNREFATTLGRALHRPAVVPTPAVAMRLALGEMADSLLLGGQRVLPARAQDLGFEFRYPLLEPALRAIYG